MPVLFVAILFQLLCYIYHIGSSVLARPKWKYLFVVVIDENSMVTDLRLDDRDYFPENQEKIVPMPVRQMWEKGDEIWINWPVDETDPSKKKKGVINPVVVTVHGLCKC